MTLQTARAHDAARCVLTGSRGAPGGEASLGELAGSCLLWLEAHTFGHSGVARVLRGFLDASVADSVRQRVLESLMTTRLLPLLDPCPGA